MVITVKGVNITVGRDTNEVKAAAEFVHHLLRLDEQAKVDARALALVGQDQRIGVSTIAS